MKIALIAGEASGDRLGARLMRALSAGSAMTGAAASGEESGIAFVGVGGAMMQAQGLQSLFPMQEIALMGFAEILPHVQRLKRRIRETVAFVERTRPDVLVTIDSPGFNFRVVKALRERGAVRPRLVHYVAPTVWAYKPERAAKTAALFDHLLVLLPFEPPYFEREGLACTFVGHAVTEDIYDLTAGAAFRARHGIADSTHVLCVLPGSRKGELKRLLPVFSEAVQRYNRAASVVIPATDYTASLLEAMPQAWPSKPLIVTGEENKRAAMLAADLALAKSGTVTLEAAMAGLPMLTAYKVHPASAWLMRRMIRTPYVSLVNILMEREVIPEYLQERCTAAALGEALAQLAENGAMRQAQRDAYREALTRLRAPVEGKTPSDVAAGIILNG